MGIISPVTDIECKYRATTTFADLISIRVSVEEFKGVKLKLKYEMKNQNDILVCEGPTIVWLSPILPFINDTKENLEGILDYCIQAHVYGIICFGMGVTLREGDREYFYEALDKHFLGMRQKYHKKYGSSYEVQSDNHKQLMKIFRDTCKKNGIVYEVDECFRYLQEFPEKYEQLTLF